MNWLNKHKLIKKFMPNLNSDRLSVYDQITLFSLVYDFLKNGFSLHEGFEFCSIIHPELQGPIKMINQHLAQGHSFAECIKSLVGFRLYCQVKIAEFHGDLIGTLGNVSKFLRIKQRQKGKLLGLMMYPVFLLILLSGIIVAIHVLVAPQMQGATSNAQSFSHGQWLVVVMLPIIVGIYILWRYYHQQSRVRQINLMLKIPLIGKICQSYYAYYLSGNLSLMMSCGMDLQRIITFMNNFGFNPLVKELSMDVKKLITHGDKLNRLRRKYHFLPKEMMILINTGDTTRVLAQKLNAYSKLEFQLMTKRTSRLISLLQPIMFLIIGVIIVGTYLSMLLPMYNSIKGVY